MGGGGGGGADFVQLKRLLNVVRLFKFCLSISFNTPQIHHTLIICVVDLWS